MVMGVNMRTGQIEIAEYDGQIRGQMDLSDFTDTDQDPELEETQATAPAFKLVAADGGLWKSQAVDNVKNYLTEALADVPDREKITIIA